jgi:hypothetical protein
MTGSIDATKAGVKDRPLRPLSTPPRPPQTPPPGAQVLAARRDVDRLDAAAAFCSSDKAWRTRLGDLQRAAAGLHAGALLEALGRHSAAAGSAEQGQGREQPAPQASARLLEGAWALYMEHCLQPAGASDGQPAGLVRSALEASVVEAAEAVGRCAAVRANLPGPEELGAMARESSLRVHAKAWLAVRLGKNGEMGWGGGGGEGWGAFVCLAGFAVQGTPLPSCCAQAGAPGPGSSSSSLDRLLAATTRLRRKAKAGPSSRSTVPHAHELLGACAEALVAAAETAAACVLSVQQQANEQQGAPHTPTLPLVAARAAAATLNAAAKALMPQLHPEPEQQQALAAQLLTRVHQVRLWSWRPAVQHGTAQRGRQCTCA